MTSIRPCDLADLDFARIARQRESDAMIWWHCLRCSLPCRCTISADVLAELSRRHAGRDVDIVFGDVYAELVVWLEPAFGDQP